LSCNRHSCIIRVIPAPPTSKVASAETQTPSSSSASKSSPVFSPPLHAPPSYKTLHSSWGGTIPQALYIDRESRAFALTRLTESFTCYWNFDVGVLYVELPYPDKQTRLQNSCMICGREVYSTELSILLLIRKCGIICFVLGRRNMAHLLVFPQLLGAWCRNH